MAGNDQFVNAALDLLPLLLLAVLPMLFIIQFFASHSRSAAWAAPARTASATAGTFAADVLDLDAARAARDTGDSRILANAA